jgi:hypothetical protein
MAMDIPIEWDPKNAVYILCSEIPVVCGRN